MTYRAMSAAGLRLTTAVDALRALEDFKIEDDIIAEALYEDAARSAAKAIEPFVGRCLVENWKKAGLGKTGLMERTLSMPVVVAKVSGKKIRLRMYMNPLAPSYVDKKGNRKSAFTVAASLNFGSVRMPKVQRGVVDLPTGKVGDIRARSPIGGRAKKTLKQLALTGKASKARMRALLEGYKLKSGERVTEGYNPGKVEFAKHNQKLGDTVHMSGGAVVIPGKEFFYLDTRQTSTIGQKFVELFAQFLQRSIDHER